MTEDKSRKITGYVKLGDGSLQIEVDGINELKRSGSGALTTDTHMSGFKIEHIDEKKKVVAGKVVAFNGLQSKGIADRLASVIVEIIAGDYYPANGVDLSQYPGIKVKKLANGDICIVNGDDEVTISSADVAELSRELVRLPRSHA